MPFSWAVKGRAGRPAGPIVVGVVGPLCPEPDELLAAGLLAAGLLAAGLLAAGLPAGWLLVSSRVGVPALRAQPGLRGPANVQAATAMSVTTTAAAPASLTPGL